MLKSFTYLRTVWHTFWMYMLVGPASPEAVEEGLAPRMHTEIVECASIAHLQEEPGNSHLRSIPEFPKQEFPAYLRPKKEPLKPNFTITNYNNRKMGERMESNHNLSAVERMDFNVPMPVSTKRLWVYNVSRVDHEFDHPQLGKSKIPANYTKKRYMSWTSFPDVVIGTQGDLHYVTIGGQCGEALVNDIIKGGGQAIGRDLSVKGVFWSYNNPPTIKEVNAAVRLMKQRYADLLEQAVILYENVQISPEAVAAIMKEKDCGVAEALKAYRVRRLDITPEHHAAAEYFKVTTPWHPVLRGQETQNV